jgi:hypothetical protein
LAFWVYKTKFSNVKLQIPDNLTQAVQSCTSSVHDLRQNKPGTYLLLVSASLVFSACIGHIISGKWVVLAGFIFAVLVSTKYQIKIIKENVAGESLQIFGLKINRRVILWCFHKSNVSPICFKNANNSNE